MLNKCCILARVTSQTSVVGRLSKNRGLPMASRGAKTHHNWPIAPFPAQGFAQRPCLRFHARQAKPNSNLGAQCCAQGLPNSAATRVPYVPCRACQTPKKHGCPTIRAGPAKLNSNLGAAQGPSNSVATRVPYVPRGACQTPKKRGCPMIHAGSTKQRCNASALCSAQGPPNSVATRVPHDPRRVRGIHQKRGCHEMRAEPAGSIRNAGAL